MREEASRQERDRARELEDRRTLERTQLAVRTPFLKCCNPDKRTCSVGPSVNTSILLNISNLYLYIFDKSVPNAHCIVCVCVRPSSERESERASGRERESERASERENCPTFLPSTFLNHHYHHYHHYHPG